jgi:hypothetical protein
MGTLMFCIYAYDMTGCEFAGSDVDVIFSLSWIGGIRNNRCMANGFVSGFVM